MTINETTKITNPKIIKPNPKIKFDFVFIFFVLNFEKKNSTSFFRFFL